MGEKRDGWKKADTRAAIDDRIGGRLVVAYILLSLLLGTVVSCARV